MCPVAPVDGHAPNLAQPAGDYKSFTRRYAVITFRQTCGYLPSRRASPPKLYCLVTEAHIGVNNWPKVVIQLE